jgi:hypothetical protein
MVQLKDLCWALKEFLSVIPGEAKDMILCRKRKNNGKFSKIFFNVFNIDFLLFFADKMGSSNTKFQFRVGGKK